jgi:hypothetical protein
LKGKGGKLFLVKWDTRARVGVRTDSRWRRSEIVLSNTYTQLLISQTKTKWSKL